MLLGEAPSLREGVLGFVKIGIVLSLATTWPAYQILVYDVVLRSPADLAATIGVPAGLPGAGGGLAARLDGVDQAFRTLAIYGVGIPPFQQVVANPPALFIGFDTFALGAARVIFLGSALGGFALLRLAAGLLLALGPLFAGFLLFDATRGLFEGWMRALIGIVLGSVATAILLGVELALFEPWLADLVARRVGNQPLIGVPAPLLATSVIFAVVLAALLFLMGRVAFGLHLPRRVAWPTPAVSATTFALAGRNPGALELRQEAAVESRSRAAAIAGGIAATQRREEAVFAAPGSTASLPSATTVVMGSGAGRNSMSSGRGALPLGQTFRRPSSGRVSASAGRRDRVS